MQRLLKKWDYLIERCEDVFLFSPAFDMGLGPGIIGVGLIIEEELINVSVFVNKIESFLYKLARLLGD